MVFSSNREETGTADVQPIPGHASDSERWGGALVVRGKEAKASSSEGQREESNQRSERVENRVQVAKIYERH